MAQSLLDAKCEFRDCDAHSFREYFKELLKTLWAEGEGFSGKRPFGNSGWKWDLYENLVALGVVKGTLDEDGYLADIRPDEREKADKIVYEMIKAL